LTVFDLFAIASVGLLSFVSTNIDNLVLLTLLLANASDRSAGVRVGYVGAVAAIVVIGFIAGRAADAIPAWVTGYLGLIPLGMGIYRLPAAFRVRRSAAADRVVSPMGPVGVAALTLSNSGDTLGVMLPLFAETPEPLTYVLAATILTSALVWLALAKWVSSHERVRRWLGGAERWLVPTLLIAVGIYILVNSPTDTELDQCEEYGPCC
jgi:cadmium resistance protein CadD (predicted permease)